MITARPEREFLSPAEVKDLTGGQAKHADQLRVLKEQGIPHRVVGRRIVVSRYHAREWLAGRLVTPTRGANLEIVR